MVVVRMSAVMALTVRHSCRMVVQWCVVVPAVYASLSYRLVLTIVVSDSRVLFGREYVVAFVVASDHTSLVMVTCVILIDCI